MANIFTTLIKEMTGRVEPVSKVFTSLWETDFSGRESEDYSKPNFYLTKAVYYVSEITNKESYTGTTEGTRYLLGAPLVKPIINSCNSFAFAQPPTIKSDTQDTEEINNWINENHSELFLLTRFALRDGVSYARVADGKLTLIPGERVEIVPDVRTGEVKGYDVGVTVKEGDSQNPVKYVTEYRESVPNIRVLKYESKSEAEVIEEVPGAEGSPMPIIAFHNQKEPGYIYGISDIQNVFYLLANYHGVLSEAVKNNIFNSKRIPYFTGIDNISNFLETNGEKQDDGTYKLRWKSESILFGSKDFAIKVMEGVKTADDAKTLLEILFWLICQTSETPEFVFGTAVRSSKASVSEQMPVMIRKAEAKRKEMEIYFRELIDLVALQLGLSLDDYSIEFPNILDDDLKLNLEVARELKQQGLITDEIMGQMLGLDKFVDDIGTEVALAKQSKSEEDTRFAEQLARLTQSKRELEQDL